MTHPVPHASTFTTSVVGSFARPKWLVEAFDRFQRGEVTKEDLDETIGDATKLTIKEEESAGLDSITDGEQSRTSFVAFVGQRIPGFKLAAIETLHPRAKEIMREEKAQLTLWRAVAGQKVRDAPMALPEYTFARDVAVRPLKVTVPSPYLLMWETWHLDSSKGAYPRPEDLAEDCVKIVRAEVLRLRDAGVPFVQLDEPMVGDLVEAGDKEPDRYRKVVERIHGQKYRGFRNELALARDLINKTVAGIDGTRIGMHLDRWPNKDSPYYDVGYERLLPEVLDIRVQQLVLEYASPGSGDPAKFLEHLPRGREVGLGVIEVRNPRVETPEDVVTRVERVVKIVDPSRIWLNPDCGFAPGMYRAFSRRIAFAKLRSMVAAADRLRKKYGAA